MDHEDIDQEITLATMRLAIPLSQTWLPAVREHLRTVRSAADLVDNFPLPDEIDQAPVFEA